MTVNFCRRSLAEVPASIVQMEWVGHAMHKLPRLALTGADLLLTAANEWAEPEDVAACLV